MTGKHVLVLEGDECACSCGLRWGVDEEDPHTYQDQNAKVTETKKLYDYAVTVEEYSPDGGFIGRSLRYCVAPHCAVAAEIVESQNPDVFAVDVIRKGLHGGDQCSFAKK